MKKKAKTCCRESLWNRSCSTERKKKKKSAETHAKGVDDCESYSANTVETNPRRVRDDEQIKKKVSQQSPVTTRTQRKLRVHKPTGEFSARAAARFQGEGEKESLATNPAEECTGEYL